MMLAAWNPAELQAFQLSLQVAAACVAVSLLPGIAIAWLLARKRFWGRSLLDALVHLPLILPPVVVGYLLLLGLGRRSLLGGWLERVFGIQLAFSWQAAVLASALMGFPLLVRSVRLSIENVDPRLIEAARSLGAPPWYAFVSITLPLALPGILTGALLSFARSLGEFGATMIFAGNIQGQTRTLPLAIFTYIQSPSGDAPAMRLVVLSVLVSFAALAASELLARRSQRWTRDA